MFCVPKFQTYEGFFHGLSVAVFRNILLFSFFLIVENRIMGFS